MAPVGARGPGRDRDAARRCVHATTRCSPCSRRSADRSPGRRCSPSRASPTTRRSSAEHDAARARGVEVWPQVSCRPLVFQMNLAEPFTLNMRESFQELMDRPTEERIAAYRDPAWRAAAWADLQGPRRHPVQLPVPVGRRVRPPPGAGRTQRGRTGRGAGRHTARRDARPVARGRPADPVLVGAGQRRPRGHRLAPPAATTCCWAWPTPAPTSASCATPASPPTCWATGCATRRSCRSSAPCTS